MIYEKKMTTKCGDTFCVPCRSNQHMWIDSERYVGVGVGVYGSRIRTRVYCVNSQCCSKFNNVTKDRVVSKEPVYSKEEIRCGS